jgi:hypothetical protein
MGDVPAEVGAFLQFTSVGQMYRLVLSWLRDDSHTRDWVWIALSFLPEILRVVAPAMAVYLTF